MMSAGKAALSKSELIPSGGMIGAVASSFKDLLGLRKYEPPEIEVTDPTVKSGAASKHTVYKVRGRDHLGEFEVMRRFREFDHLRRVLYSRFLGLYVPPIPEKKAMGNTEGLFVEERLYFLDRFMKEVCQLPYLYESEEFQAFLRSPDTEKALDTLPRLTTDDLLNRFRTVMPVNEMAGDLKIKSHNESINDFVRDCRDYLEHLKGFKKHIKVIVPIKEAEVNYYREFVDFLVKYEDTNAKKHRVGDPSVSLLTGENKIDLKT
jgi:sorting nexin-1/2